MSALKHQVVSGLKWSLAAKLSSQLFSWISTFMVLRLLTPDDYGIMALAMVFFAFISFFSTQGLVSALVRRQAVDAQSFSHIFTLSIGLNLALSAGVAASAPFIALWYDNAALKEVLWVLAIINPLQSFAVVPQARLQIAMRFKAKSLVEGLSGLVGAVVGLAAAYAGEAYWALVFANIAMTLVRVVGLCWLVPYWPCLARHWQGSRDLLMFSLQVQLGTLVWFLYSKADTVLLARTLGVDKAGIYSVASEVASVPMSKINAIMNEVAFSAFAKTREDHGLAAQYLRKAIKLMAVMAFPMFYGISAIADDMVLVLMGPVWMPAAPVIAILCLVLPFRMLGSVLTNYATGMGEALFSLHNVIITAVVLISAIAVGAQYGVTETAWAWTLGYSVVFMIFLIRYRRRFALSFSTLTVFWPSLLIAIFMLTVIHSTQYWLTMTGVVFSPVVSLSLKIILGILVSTPLLYWYCGKEILSLLKR